MIFVFLKFSSTIFLFIFTYKSSEKQTKVFVIKSKFKAEFRTCNALLVISWSEWKEAQLLFENSTKISTLIDTYIQIFASILQCMHCIGICGREEAFVKCTSANIDEWVTLLFWKEDWVIEFINIMLPKYLILSR